jgi:uncharacterized protein YndB with AHSA1/START domain
MTRSFNAPREIVYEAMTDVKHIPNWWGPAKYSLVVCESDLRVGGEWRFVERAEDGGEHPFKGEWKELDPPRRFAFTQIYDVPPFDDKSVLITIVLTEEDGRTLMTETMTFDSKQDRDGMLQSGMEGGASESLDRLDALVTKLAGR